MISFKGKSVNIKEPTICRIVLPSSQIACNRSEFLLVNNWNELNNHHHGVILNSLEKLPYPISSPLFQYHSEDILNEGDILFINPNGEAIKLYDPMSFTNSILLTEKCNCRCLLCPQPPKEADDFDWINLSIKAIELMNPETECLGITGGEPTENWSGLIKVIETCKTCLQSTKIQLLTNARVLKDYEKVKELFDAGGKNLFVGVTIYSDIDLIHDKLTGAKGAFWDSIEGLYNLERAGVFIELRTVITKANYERLPQFAEFVYRTMPFVGYVAFMAMEPIGLALKNIKKLWIDSVDYIPQLECAVKILWRRDIGVALFNHQLCTLPRHLWELSKKSISEWKIIYMNECEGCIEKNNCGGFFFSATKYKSRGISPIF